MTKSQEEQVSEERRRLGNPYAYLDGDGGYGVFAQVAVAHSFHLDLDEIRSPELVGKRFYFETIEEIVKSLQNSIWRKRRLIWKDETPDDVVTILNPEVALEAIGYNFEWADSLGQFMTSKGMMDIAGYIDKSQKYAGVSSHLPLPTQNFTAAHELGHAVLHNAIGMHRDQALDSGGVSSARDRIEVEADKFASFFLMPEKVVRAEFQRRFASEQFVISDDTAFALINGSQDALRNKFTNLRRLARKLADADYYSGRVFEPLTKRFKVSTEAMAIRLEELRLLQF